MKWKNSLAFILTSLFFGMVLLSPRETADATYEALLLFVKRVLPALFLSLCLSSVLVESPICSYFYRYPFGVEAALFVLGVFCGFPVGAKSALQLYRAGYINKKRAEFLCTFTNLASVPFLTGVVAGGTLGDDAFGIRLVLLQAVSALLVGAIMFFVLRPDCRGVNFVLTNSSVSLPSAVSGAVLTLLHVCGMIVFFDALAKLLLSTFHFGTVFSALVCGVMELSLGCFAAVKLPETIALLLTGSIVGFSGLCVASQISAVVDEEFSLVPFFVSKVLQGILLPLLLILTR